MSNPVAPPSCVHAKTMAVAANDDSKTSQGKMGKFQVCADAPSAAPVFDEVLSEAGAESPLSSRSVHQAEGASTASGAQSLEVELIELAKVAAIEHVSTEEDEWYSIACMRQMYELLKKPEVNVNQADEDGWTALHHAANADNQVTVTMLLLNGHIKADKTIKNKDGKVPVDLAKPGSPAHKFLSVDDLAKMLSRLPGEREGEFFVLVADQGFDQN